MRAPRFLQAALFASALSAVFAGCGDRTPLGVSPQQELLGTVVETVSRTARSLALLRCDPLPAASTTRWIGPRGGTLYVGPHTLRIPEHALSHWVRITATAPSDSVNHVHFEPEGLQFNKNASLTMSYANCNGLGSLLPKRVVYTSDDLLSILDVLLSLDSPFTRTVTGRVNHFSQYAVAW